MPKRVQHKPTTSDDTPPRPQAYVEYMRFIARKGGRASGARRMTNLTPQQRSRIARKAALARWTKKAEER